MPPNLADAKAFDPTVAPAPARPEDFAIDVATPDGRVVAIDDPSLAAALGQNVTLLRSDKAIIDSRPVSLFSVQTARRLGDELGRPVDKLRFRANIYLDLDAVEGFGEDAFVGRTLEIGDRVRVHVLERDVRCALTTLDPNTAERDFGVIKTVNAGHDGCAGVYGAVLVEGRVRAGDPVTVADP